MIAVLIYVYPNADMLLSELCIEKYFILYSDTYTEDWYAAPAILSVNV
jgi:hypothetical protein